MTSGKLLPFAEHSANLGDDRSTAFVIVISPAAASEEVRATPQLKDSMIIQSLWSLSLASPSIPWIFTNAPVPAPIKAGRASMVPTINKRTNLARLKQRSFFTFPSLYKYSPMRMRKTDSFRSPPFDFPQFLADQLIVRQASKVNAAGMGRIHFEPIFSPAQKIGRRDPIPMFRPPRLSVRGASGFGEELRPCRPAFLSAPRASRSWPRFCPGSATG